MHAWCRGATRRYAYSYKDNEIQLYRTLSSHAGVAARHYRELISKGAEPCLEQPEFALSTDPLRPDPPKQRMVQIRTRSAKPNLLLRTDRSMVQMNRVDVLRSILDLHTNTPYKRNLALSELARAMHHRKSIHSIHVRFRNSENACELTNLKN